MSVFAGALDGGEFCETAGPAQAGQTRSMFDRNMLVGTGKTMRLNPRRLRQSSEAFGAALKELNEGGPSKLVLEVVAQRIIEAASNGERDPVRLLAAALAGRHAKLV